MLWKLLYRKPASSSIMSITSSYGSVFSIWWISHLNSGSLICNERSFPILWPEKFSLIMWTFSQSQCRVCFPTVPWCLQHGHFWLVPSLLWWQMRLYVSAEVKLSGILLYFKNGMSTSSGQDCSSLLFDAGFFILVEANHHPFVQAIIVSKIVISLREQDSA